METTATNKLERNPLGTEKIGKLMLSYAIPGVIAMVVNSIYNMVDQVFIGQGVGYLGNAGTNVIMPIMTVLMALSVMFGAGAATYMSLKLGRNETEAASRGACGAMTMIVAVGVVLAILCSVFLEPLCKLFGSTDNVLPYAMDYGRIIVLGFPLSAISCSFSEIIRADGQPKQSMIGLLIGTVTNLILDPVFVFGFGWGMKGAALATIIGQALCAVFFIWCCFKFKTLKPKKEYFIPDMKTTGRIMALGVSNFITQFSIVIMTAVLNNLIAKYGPTSEYGADIPLSAMGIVMKVSQLATAIVLGVATGTQPIIGYNYGKGQYKRVKSTYWYALISTTIVMVIARIIFWIFPEQIIGLFGTESETYVTFAVKCFNIMLLSLPVLGVFTETGILFQAIGKPVMSMFLSLTKNIIYFIPVVMIMAAFMGLDGILWGIPLADTLSCLTCIIALVVYWKKIFKEEHSR